MSVPYAFEQTVIDVLPTEENTVATRTSDTLRYKHARALLITVVLSNKAGTTATYTPRVRYAQADGTLVTLWTAASALTNNGTTTYLLGLHQGGTVTGITEAKACPIPGTFVIDIVVGGTADGSNNCDTQAEVEIFPY